MGLTEREDGWYVEFRVIEDGSVLKLAEGISGAKLKRWKVGQSSKAEAWKQEAIIRTKLLSGQIESKQEKAKQITFAQWVVRYLEIEKVKALRSYRERCQRIQQVLLPFFGKKLLTAITVQDIEDWRATRAEEVMPATVNVDKAILQNILFHAMRLDLVTSNKAELVASPKPNNERDRTLNQEEWKRLYSAAPDWFKPVLLTGYHTGMRLEEILGLTWKEVSLEKSCINLPGARTKNKKDRSVPLTPSMRNLLRGLRHQGGVVKMRRPTELVFTKDEKRICNTHKVVQDICRQTGIKDWRFHDLRHMAVTALSEAGVPIEDCMTIVGHSSVQMYLRYRATRTEKLDQAMVKLEAHLAR